jgi:hypothetical protein
VVQINSSAYGFITIDDKTYRHDVYVHACMQDQVEYVLKESPDTVIIGKGTSGLASLNPEARAFLEKEGTEIVEADTPDIRGKFNELAQTKRVAAIIHVTC